MSTLHSDFESIITDKLAEEFSDQKTAQQIAPYINESVFTHSPPYIAICEADVVIALAFGNRPNSTGNENELADPEPMNKDLADCCAQFYRKKTVPMYMQWEIASFFLKDNYPDIPSKDIFSINPDWDENGKLIYLSTDGTIEAIIKNYFDGDPTKMGTAAIIGHRDHIKRCVMTCRNRQIKASAPRDINFPVWYDEQSWQAWTRRRDLYVLQDIAVQLLTQAQQNIAAAYP